MVGSRESNGGRNRRRFLQLLGASGASVGLVGSGVADGSGSSGPSVSLSVDAPDRCGPRRCEGVDYYVPVGAELEFSASVSGKYAVADVRQRHLDTGEVESREACTGDVDDCERFTLSFEKPGEHEIRYEAWDVDAAATTDGEATAQGERNCDRIDDLGCDTIRCRVGEPTVSLEANDSTVEVGETVWFTARLDPPLQDADWEFRTYRVDDEEADPDRATPGGQNWFRRPLEPGEYVAVVTATVGETTFEAIERLTVEATGELEATDATISDDGESITGSVTLRNGTDDERTVEIALRTFGDVETILEREQRTISAGERETISLSGAVDADVLVAALELDGTEFAESTLIDRR